jgi:hypothetical protein
LHNRTQKWPTQETLHTTSKWAFCCGINLHKVCQQEKKKPVKVEHPAIMHPPQKGRGCQDSFCFVNANATGGVRTSDAACEVLNCEVCLQLMLLQLQLVTCGNKILWCCMGSGKWRSMPPQNIDGTSCQPLEKVACTIWAPYRAIEHMQTTWRVVIQHLDCKHVWLYFLLVMHGMLDAVHETLRAGIESSLHLAGCIAKDKHCGWRCIRLIVSHNTSILNKQPLLQMCQEENSGYY